MKIAIANSDRKTADIIRKVVSQKDGHTIAWIAGDGREAVELCKKNRPEILLMDVRLPILNGVEAVKQIMARTPCSILIVTSNVDENAALVFEAMGHGAMDVIPAPVMAGDGSIKGAERLIRKIEIIGRLTGKNIAPVVCEPAVVKSQGPVPLVCIGASTGGPKAIAGILEGIPAGFQGCLVVVQHIDFQFAEGFATWLQSQTRLKVLPAMGGEIPVPGTVFVSVKPDHLVFSQRRRLSYVIDENDPIYKPSIDIFFSSAANNCETPGMAVLLTGMGKDGAAGLLALKKAGWLTVAQDEESCAVYGMPRAAAERNAAMKILPLARIADSILAFSQVAKTKQ